MVPMLLALYGHPDSGGIWENHLNSRVVKQGWKQILPDIWHSFFHHQELNCLLVVYVDDFKMAGPTANMEKAWASIKAAVNIGDPEPYDRYFGCMHREFQNIRLPSQAHPFAFAFEAKKSAAAQHRTQDWWEHDETNMAWNRHHVQPRKILYQPGDEGGGCPSITDGNNQGGYDVYTDDWKTSSNQENEFWTGKTVFCYGQDGPDKFKHFAMANSYTFSDLEWLRIYNAAVKRGGILLSVGSMTVMVNMNDDLQATDREYMKWKRGLMSGIGGTIAERPLVRKEKAVLAEKFRFGKTILITDLVYKCSSNARGMTNIQYGLDEMGYAITVIDINSFKSVTRAQKFLDAVEHLKRNVMPDIAAEENVTIHVWISFAFLITDHHPYHVWVEGNFAERLAEAIRSVDKMATRPIFVSLCKDSRFHGIPCIWHPGRRHGLGRHFEKLRNHGHH